MAISSSSGSNSFGDSPSSLPHPFPPLPSTPSPKVESRLPNGTQQQPTRRWLLCIGMQRSSTSGLLPRKTSPKPKERKTSSSCSRRNWRTAKTTASLGREPTPPKRSTPPPATTQRQEKTPTNSSKTPRRGAKKEAAAADKTAVAAMAVAMAATTTTTTMMMTTAETHRREARSTVGI